MKKMLVVALSALSMTNTWAQSFDEWKQRAEAGDAAAQHNLGVMYENGHGVRQNHSTAKEWFGKACDGGLQAGCDHYKRLKSQGY